MTAARAWQEMLAADQLILRCKKLGAEPIPELVDRAADAHAAFDEAVGVWGRK